MPTFRHNYTAPDDETYTLVISYSIDQNSQDFPEVENPNIEEVFDDNMHPVDFSEFDIDYEDLLDWAQQHAMMGGFE